MRHRAAFLLIALAGCVTPKPVRFVSPDFQAQSSRRVAVLPFDNESTDLVGPKLLRGLVESRLGGRGYTALGVDEVDEKLRNIGITDGGQLRAVDPKKLGETLGVDGLLYGVVEEFTFINVGFAMRRMVRLHMKYVRSSTGEVLWEDTGQGVTDRITVKKKDAGRAFVEGIVERAAENTFRTPLMPESLAAVQSLLMRLPPVSIKE